MDTKTARTIGIQLATKIRESDYQAASLLLRPILRERIPFRLLDILGNEIGRESSELTNPFLENMAAEGTMGGWIVIASALQQQAKTDLSTALIAVCHYVIQADVWYAADSFGERVPGHTLVNQFNQTLSILSGWRDDPNRWVRRMVGVSAHYWAKQAHGKSACMPQVERLLDLLKPMFTERDQDAIKGIGWGLKTLGRYYPDIVVEWLIGQSNRPHRALMMRKAIKYLPAALREKVTGRTS